VAKTVRKKSIVKMTGEMLPEILSFRLPAATPLTSYCLLTRAFNFSVPFIIVTPLLYNSLLFPSEIQNIITRRQRTKLIEKSVSVIITAQMNGTIFLKHYNINDYNTLKYYILLMEKLRKTFNALFHRFAAKKIS